MQFNLDDALYVPGPVVGVGKTKRKEGPAGEKMHKHTDSAVSTLTVGEQCLALSSIG